MLKQMVVIFIVLAVSFGVKAEWSESSDINTQTTEKTPKMRIAAHSEIACETCHAVLSEPDLPPNTVCLSCHAPFEKIVQATSNYQLNPHDSPHWGQEVPCATCHLQHQAPKVLCASCHLNEPYKAR